MVSGNRFTELLSSQVLLGDGAMGTMLYAQGIYINRCFDALNVENPDLVKQVHTQYAQEGVDFLETNTFGANEYRLAKYGMGKDVERINRCAVQLARAAAKPEILVAGAIGPIGIELTEHGRLTVQQAEEMFRLQAEALATEGVDFFILETFSNTGEILAAIRAVSSVTEIPIVAQMTADH